MVVEISKKSKPMGKAHIFTDDGKQWKLIPELLIKPNQKDYESGGDPPMMAAYVDPSYYDALELYEHQLAEAKANALPIVNPELIGYDRNGVFYMKYFLLPGHSTDRPVEVGELYEWPGTWEIYPEFDPKNPIRVAKLIAPQQNSAHGYTEGADAPQQPISRQFLRSTERLEAFEMANRVLLKDLRDQLSKEQEEKSKVLNAVKEVAAKGAEAKEQLEKEREIRKELMRFLTLIPIDPVYWVEYQTVIAKASELDKNKTQ